MDEKYFQPSSSGGGLRSFDAFPKTRKSFVTQTPRGGLVTALVLLGCLFLSYHEFTNYLLGNTRQYFHIDPSIGYHMQINLDITVAMACQYLDVNVQDAAGDRILAGEMLTKENTVFQKMVRGHHLFEDIDEEYDDHLHDVVGKNKKGSWHRKRSASAQDACRIYGSMEVNRVQGDFHITARGHGYFAPNVEHLDHDRFNFSHAIDELSFGEYYPKLVNPLDETKAITDDNFHRFQYYLSVVPTRYISHTRGMSLLTNQYAVNHQERNVNEWGIPGIFFKYEIEPISLTVEDTRMPFVSFVIRLVNVLSGMMVAGGWVYAVWDTTVAAIRRRRRSNTGVLNGGHYKDAE